MTDLKQPILVEQHRDAGAHFTDFAGWNMPVRYSSDLAEHHAVRTAAGVFDVSHMAEIRVTGEEAGAFLDSAVSSAISTLAINQAKYSLLLTEDAGIIDDLIIYRLAEQEFLVIANAGNRFAVASALHDRSVGFQTEVQDESDAYALLALQGPKAEAVLVSLAESTDLGVGAEEIRNLKYYRYLPATYGGGELGIARTGYTGEDGFELLIPAEQAVAFWTELFAQGTPHGLVPAGLAARDTLRLEAGFPLYGHELSTQTNPYQAGLGRVVALGKEADFVGKEAAKRLSEITPERVLAGLVAEGRRAARSGYAIFSGETQVGEVTSGALSPTLGFPIALALVDPAYSGAGTALEFDVRGTRIPATVTAIPFYQRVKKS